MKEYDVAAWVQHELTEKKGLAPYRGGVLEELKKLSVKTNLKTRPHTFTNGASQVADKLIIEIDFSNVAVQPDSYFEEHFAGACVAELEDCIMGIWEADDLIVEAGEDMTGSIGMVKN